MRAVSAAFQSGNTEISRTEIRQTEESFGSIIGDVARLLWPRNTAAEVASVTGCTVRSAELYLGGHQKWSGDAVAAIVAEVLKRHSMRNAKVIAKR